MNTRMVLLTCSSMWQ